MSQIRSFTLTNVNNAAHFLFMKDFLERAFADENIQNSFPAQVKALQIAVKQERECSSISKKA